MSPSAGRPFTVLLCEGYHDRAFLAEGLAHLRWRDLGRGAPNDLWGRVDGGDYAFEGEDGARLRLRPCRGAEPALKQVETALRDRATRPVDRVVLCLDGDVGGEGPDAPARACQRVAERIRRHAPGAQEEGDGVWRLDPEASGGPCEVRLVLWHTDAPVAHGVPTQQCLERLVCAAAAEVWPERFTAAVRFLADRPSPSWREDSPGDSPKTPTLTLMGAWFADHGCDDFYRLLWRTRSGPDHLRRLLGEAAWRRLTDLGAPPPAPVAISP